MHAYVENGSLVQFLAALPFTFKGVRRISSLTVAEQAALGLLPVVDMTPAFNPELTQLAKARPGITIFPDRVEIVRQTEPVPAQEITDRSERVALQEDPRVIELRSKLRTGTPAQISDYVDAQVADLPSARSLFKGILLLLAAGSR